KRDLLQNRARSFRNRWAASQRCPAEPHGAAQGRDRPLREKSDRPFELLPQYWLHTNGAMPRKGRRTRTGRFAFLGASKCLSPAYPEDATPDSVGRTGEVDAHDRDTRMRRINRNDCLIELEITILVIDEGRPVGPDVGPAIRPGQDRFGMQAVGAVA